MPLIPPLVVDQLSLVTPDGSVRTEFWYNAAGTISYTKPEPSWLGGGLRLDLKRRFGSIWLFFHGFSMLCGCDSAPKWPILVGFH